MKKFLGRLWFLVQLFSSLCLTFYRAPPLHWAAPPKSVATKQRMTILWAAAVALQAVVKNRLHRQCCFQIWLPFMTLQMAWMVVACRCLTASFSMGFESDWRLPRRLCCTFWCCFVSAEMKSSRRRSYFDCSHSAWSWSTSDWSSSTCSVAYFSMR